MWITIFIQFFLKLKPSKLIGYIRKNGFLNYWFCSVIFQNDDRLMNYEPFFKNYNDF